MGSNADVNMVVYAEIEGLNKKRKFSADQLGLPLSKHKCSSNGNLEDPNLYVLHVGTSTMSANSASRPSSERDSNSLPGDVDSIMSMSGEVKNYMWYSKPTPSDQPSTSSVNSGSHCLEKSLYSLDSRSLTKSSSENIGSSYMHSEEDLLRGTFGLRSSSSYGDHLSEFGSYEDYRLAEYNGETMEQPTDKEIEDLHLLYSNGVAPNNYVLSSGRWAVNKDADADADAEQGGTKKLTIDKEFEEYFSMLML